MQVPELSELLTDDSDLMLTDESTLKGDTDFLTEELSFSTLAPVQFTKADDNGAESPEHPSSRGSSPEQRREYLDLDRKSDDSQEMSFYDDFAKNGLLNATVKSEHCFSPVASGQIDVPFDPIELEVIFRDQMEEIQTVCQSLGMLPGTFPDFIQRRRNV